MADNAWTGWIRIGQESYRSPTGSSSTGKTKPPEEILSKAAVLEKVKKNILLNASRGYKYITFRYIGIIDGDHTYELRGYSTSSERWYTWRISG